LAFATLAFATLPFAALAWSGAAGLAFAGFDFAGFDFAGFALAGFAFTLAGALRADAGGAFLGALRGAALRADFTIFFFLAAMVRRL
jgi:hypothetical protein